jgi:molybdopterin molybdotransferase
MQSILTLEKAIKTILARTTITGSEAVSLTDALGRVPAKTLVSLVPQPGYDQSTYDGYVIPKRLPEEIDGFLEYRLAGEIAAGDTSEKCVLPGSTYRIMTGGALPKGGWKVIPQEICREIDGAIALRKAQVVTGAPNTRKRGSGQRLGSKIASAGEPLTPGQLGKLADAGHLSVNVHRRPKVSFFCTGSELVDGPVRQQKGLKVSSNRYLLDGLIRSLGGITDDRGTVVDEMTKMCNILGEIVDSSKPDIIISTGGMGPGKYDMLEETFSRMGGEIVFTSLQLRPGKSTLFGVLGGSLYFGLPGPPPAVRALFHELVRPGLLKAQGMKKQGPNVVRAYLEDDLVIKKGGVLKLQEGIVSLARGMCTVRPARKRENSNCYLLCPGHRRVFRKGELMTVHSLQPPFHLSVQ